MRRQVHHDGDGPRTQDARPLRQPPGPDLGGDRGRPSPPPRDPPPRLERLDNPHRRRPRPPREGGEADGRPRGQGPVCRRPQSRGGPPPRLARDDPGEVPADTWLAAAFVDYERIVALELAFKAKDPAGALDGPETDRLELARYEVDARRWLATLQVGDDIPLDKTAFDLTRRAPYEIAATKGVEVLAAVRRELGDKSFLALNDSFGRAHAGKAVTTAEYFEAAAKAKGKPIDPATLGLITKSARPTRPSWSVDTFTGELGRTLIVHGTTRDVAAQREAADRLQRQIARRWPNIYVTIKADTAATADDLRSNHVLLVGRPDANAVTGRLATELPVSFGPTSFRVAGETYGHASSAVIAAGPNPLNPRFEVVVFAGLGAESTWKAVQALPGRNDEASNVLVLAVGSAPRAIVVRSVEAKSGAITLRVED